MTRNVFVLILHGDITDVDGFGENANVWVYNLKVLWDCMSSQKFICLRVIKRQRKSDSHKNFASSLIRERNLGQNPDTAVKFMTSRKLAKQFSQLNGYWERVWMSFTPAYHSIRSNVSDFEKGVTSGNVLPIDSTT